MPTEIRRLHPLSWLFMTATSVKGLILPAIVVLFVSSSGPLARYELLSLLVVGPAFVAALLKQGIYNYRFAADELVIRDGILIKKERHIPYDRVHNIALVRNPFHRLLGVASARVETAAGGKAEATMSVLTLEAVEELRRYALGKQHRTAAAAPGAAESILLSIPPGELVRLGLVSNRGFVVVAALFGLVWQFDWWEQDWQVYYGRARALLERGQAGDAPPTWITWLLEDGSFAARLLLGVGILLAFVVFLRVFSIAWSVFKYYGFILQRENEDLRTEFGLLTRVSSLIPVHRIQLLTISAPALHRCIGRGAIDLETAGAQEGGGSELDTELATSGAKTSRQWLAPIIESRSASALVREVMSGIDLDAVAWESLAPRAARRILKKSTILLLAVTGAAMAAVSLTPIPVSAFHALWLPVFALPLIYVGVNGWLRYTAYALTDDAVLFRSGWLSRQTSVVRFNKMQTVWVKESPFDRRHRMAAVAVDTAGAGSFGHRIDIPYLDVDVARAIRDRLYAETCATEYSW